MTIDRTEIVSLRYHAWLKRRWWLAPLAALIIAILSQVALNVDGYESSVDFGPVTNSALLQLSGLEGDAIAKAVPLRVEAVAISGKTVLAEARDAVGNDVDVDVIYDERDDTFVLNVFGPTEEAVTRAKEFYIDKVIQLRTQRLVSASNAIVDSLTTLRDAAELRISEVEAAILALPEGAPGEVTAAWLDELKEVQTELREIESHIDAVQRLPTTPSEIAIVSSTNDIDPRSGQLPVTIAAALFAALCVLLVGYLMAMLDWRIRSESDVALSLGTALPVVCFNAASEVRRLSAILDGLAKTHSVSTVKLVAVDNVANARSVAKSVAIELTGRSKITVIGTGPPDEDIESLVSDGATVLHAVQGKTTATQLRRLSDELAVIGVKPAALLLESR